MGAELFYTDGRTDMTNLIVAFRNFANGPKKEAHFLALGFSVLQNEYSSPFANLLVLF
jgi:hypothetical protein